jgi:hypothetical protein
VPLDESQNEELLRLSKQILELTDAIHRLTVTQAGSGGTPSAADAAGPTGEDA